MTTRGKRLRPTVPVALVVTGTVALAMLGAVPATAASTETVSQDGALRIVSVRDDAAMAAMVPGEPVVWDVGISTTAPGPGTVTVSITTTTGQPGQFEREIRSCTVRWAGSACPGVETVVRTLAPAVATAAETLVQFAVADERWLRVAVVLVGAPAQPADVVFDIEALGAGAADTVSSTGSSAGSASAGTGRVTGPTGPLAHTGVDLWRALLTAVGAVSTGLLLALLARRGRRAEVHA